MSASYRNIGGVFHKDSKHYDNINGVWRSTKKDYDNIGGVWHQSYTSIPDVGGTYVFGGYNWTVVDITNGQATLVCQSTVGGAMKFSSNTGNNRAYYADGNCVVRNYLNGTFYNLLSSSDRALLIGVPHRNYIDTLSNITAPTDYVWPLSMSEMYGVGASVYCRGPYDSYHFYQTLRDEGAQLQWFAGKTAAQIYALLGNYMWTRTNSEDSTYNYPKYVFVLDYDNFAVDVESNVLGGSSIYVYPVIKISA